MRLNLILPVVQPETFDPPRQCVYAQCGSRQLCYRQTVTKALVDGKYTQVPARRYACQRCGRTFRVYPAGVCKKQMSQRVIGLAVMLYALGLSYGAVALVLAALALRSAKAVCIARCKPWRSGSRVCNRSGFWRRIAPRQLGSM